MTRLRFLPVTGGLLATIMTVAACGSAGSSSTAPAAAPSTRQAENAAFASALAAWKNAAAANAATMGMYLQQAADDLRASSGPGYGTAVNELTYLEHLPATNDTPTQQANAHSDVQALDRFFGTPGLMS